MAKLPSQATSLPRSFSPSAEHVWGGPACSWEWEPAAPQDIEPSCKVNTFHLNGRAAVLVVDVALRWSPSWFSLENVLSPLPNLLRVVDVLE